MVSSRVRGALNWLDFFSLWPKISAMEKILPSMRATLMTPDSSTICSSDLQGTSSLRIIETLLPKHPITEWLPLAVHTAVPRLRGGKSFPAKPPNSPHPAPHRVLGPFLTTVRSLWAPERPKRVPFPMPFYFGAFWLWGPALFTHSQWDITFSWSKSTDFFFFTGILPGLATLLGSQHHHQQ